jgi:hypothetical protein
LSERHEYVIEMRANGLERFAQGDAVERLDHIEKGAPFKFQLTVSREPLVVVGY